MESTMNKSFCQSCGMPLENEEVLGTNADASKNQEYCTYCYEDGAFSADISMEQMIDFCVDYSAKEDPTIDKATAKKMMLEYFPTLKRWKKA